MLGRRKKQRTHQNRKAYGGSNGQHGCCMGSNLDAEHVDISRPDLAFGTVVFNPEAEEFSVFGIDGAAIFDNRPAVHPAATSRSVCGHITSLAWGCKGLLLRRWAWERRIPRLFHESRRCLTRTRHLDSGSSYLPLPTINRTDSSVRGATANAGTPTQCGQSGAECMRSHERSSDGSSAWPTLSRRS